LANAERTQRIPPPEEPDAVVPHVRVCEGASAQALALLGGILKRCPAFYAGEAAVGGEGVILLFAPPPFLTETGRLLIQFVAGCRADDLHPRRLRHRRGERLASLDVSQQRGEGEFDCHSVHERRMPCRANTAQAPCHHQPCAENARQIVRLEVRRSNRNGL